MTVTTASKLKYKILLADDYANRHLYAKAYNELYHIEQEKLFEAEKKIWKLICHIMQLYWGVSD